MNTLQATLRTKFKSTISHFLSDNLDDDNSFCAILGKELEEVFRYCGSNQQYKFP